MEKILPPAERAAQDDFYRPPASKEPAPELECRPAIVKNLKAIRDETADLDALEHRLLDIITAMRLVRELSAWLNLEQLELRIASISAALKLIETDASVQELKAER